MSRRYAPRTAAAVCLLALSLAVLGAPAGSAPLAGRSAGREHPFREGYVLVGYREGVVAKDRAAIRRSVGSLDRRLLPRTDLVALDPGVDVAEAIAAIATDPHVAYAEPDYLVAPTDIPDDPYYLSGDLWGMYGNTTTPSGLFGSQAAEAWAEGDVGSSRIVVGVIDEGIDVSHPDLADNIWTNPGEIAGDGIDNDGNGYVDDVHGWDFVNDDNSVYDPADGDQHGTHVAGTIGAVGGNATGVAGVNWRVTMIAAKFLGPDGGYLSDAVDALRYLIALKTRTVDPVDIVATNNSWGGGGDSKTLRDAIIAAGNAGILFVAAAGNESSDNDRMPSYPASTTCKTRSGFDCVVTVASISGSGAMSWFSNYGRKSVDLGAPGSDVLSTLPGGAYGTMSGTSMATPHVTGAIALCAAIGPPLAAGQLRAAVLDSAAATAALSGRTVTGGRLDIGAMRDACRTGTLDVSVAGSGSVRSSVVGIACGGGGAACSAETGGTVTLTAVADRGWRFASWDGCDTVSGPTCRVAVNADRTVTATFAPLPYQVRVSTSRPKGTAATVDIATSGPTTWTVVGCSGRCTNGAVAAGTVVTLTANLAPGASTVTWRGCDSTTATTCTVTVDGNESVVVRFSA